MAKDPAFLFYYQDFLVGTMFMSNEERGKYITVICHLADKGSLSESELRVICGGEICNSVLSKLSKSSNGNFYNKRLNEEVEKRKNYSKSRRINRLKNNHMNNICETYVQHMENENENEIENENGDKDKVFLKERSGFKKPGIEELKDALETGGLDAASALVEASKFLDYYESVGWVVGRTRKPMKNWRGAVSTWLKNRREWEKDSAQRPNPMNLNKKQLANMEALSDFAEGKRTVRQEDLRAGDGSVIRYVSGDKF